MVKEQNLLMLLLAVGALLILLSIFLICKLFVREKARNAELAMRLQRIHFEAGFLLDINELYSGIRTWQHDFENNLRVLRTLICEAETEQALRFMDGMNQNVMNNKIVLRTGNLALDAIVSAKLVMAKSHGIDINVKAMYPEGHGISDNDLCAIVANLLDNAIEACLRIIDESLRKFIDVLITTKKKNLCLEISNSYDNEIRKKNGCFITSKNDSGHGMGMKHIDTIVNKYSGHVSRSQDDNIFETRIVLPLFTTRNDGVG